MRSVFTVLLSIILILMLTFSASAEIVVDSDEIWQLVSNVTWDTISSGTCGSLESGSSQATVSGKNNYVNIANGSLMFYVSGSGKANVIYTVSLKDSYKKSATVAIYIEKHLFGPFWQRLDTEWSETFSDKYHADNLSCNLKDEGEYRAVMFLYAGTDSCKLVSEFKYEKGYLHGDVNKDNKINAADARLVLRYSAKLESSSDIRTRGDMNGDGKITASDARMILKLS